MPLHDVGYRAWRGSLRGSISAIAVIAATGTRLAWSNRWLRRAVFFAWSPAVLCAFLFFAFEQAVHDGRLGAIRETAKGAQNIDGIGVLGKVIADSLGATTFAPGDHPDPDERIRRTRRAVWSRLLLAFMRSPQGILLAIVVGLVAPTLVSRDLRAKAWLIYFTRPVGKLEYVVGKLLVLGLLVAVITLLPALALWVMGVAVSPSAWVAVTTWDLPLRIATASVVVTLPTVLMALAYSSMTAESRIASFAWFATWVACWVAHTSLTTADMIKDAGVQQVENSGGMQVDEDRSPQRGFNEPRLPFDPRRIRWLSRATGLDPAIDRWAWISPYHALGVVQSWIFGIETRPEAVVPPALSLSIVALLSIAVLWWRVDAPARV